MTQVSLPPPITPTRFYISTHIKVALVVCSILLVVVGGSIVGHYIQPEQQAQSVSWTHPAEKPTKIKWVQPIDSETIIFPTQIIDASGKILKVITVSKTEASIYKLDGTLLGTMTYKGKGMVELRNDKWELTEIFVFMDNKTYDVRNPKGQYLRTERY